MSTIDIIDVNEYYGVTIRAGRQVSPGTWRAEAIIFRSDTREQVQTLFGSGGTRRKSENRAKFDAKELISSLGTPDNWQRRQ